MFNLPSNYNNRKIAKLKIYADRKYKSRLADVVAKSIIEQNTDYIREYYSLPGNFYITNIEFRHFYTGNYFIDITLYCNSFEEIGSFDNVPECNVISKRLHSGDTILFSISVGNKIYFANDVVLKDELEKNFVNALDNYRDELNFLCKNEDFLKVFNSKLRNNLAILEDQVKKITEHNRMIFY